jgi:hypothetical protein
MVGRDAEEVKELESWRAGELESWRAGELESWRAGELESWRNYVGLTLRVNPLSFG